MTKCCRAVIGGLPAAAIHTRNFRRFYLIVYTSNYTQWVGLAVRYSYFLNILTILDRLRYDLCSTDVYCPVRPGHCECESATMSTQPGAVYSLNEEEIDREFGFTAELLVCDSLVEDVDFGNSESTLAEDMSLSNSDSTLVEHKSLSNSEYTLVEDVDFSNSDSTLVDPKSLSNSDSDCRLIESFGSLALDHELSMGSVVSLGSSLTGCHFSSTKSVPAPEADEMPKTSNNISSVKLLAPAPADRSVSLPDSRDIALPVSRTHGESMQSINFRNISGPVPAICDESFLASSAIIEDSSLVYLEGNGSFCEQQVAASYGASREWSRDPGYLASFGSSERRQHLNSTEIITSRSSAKSTASKSAGFALLRKNKRFPVSKLSSPDLQIGAPPLKRSPKRATKWTPKEDRRLEEGVKRYGLGNWVMVAKHVKTRNNKMCSQRWRCNLRPETKAAKKTGPWSKQEDEQLRKIVRECGHKEVHFWQKISESMGFTRNSKQCRERWTNFLDPTLRLGPWTKEEDALLLNLYSDSGNAWTKFTKVLTGRCADRIRRRLTYLKDINRVPL